MEDMDSQKETNKALLASFSPSKTQPLATARPLSAISSSTRDDGSFLSLEPGQDIDILSMKGPRGLWIARNHGGAVGFVRCKDVTVLSYDVDQELLVQMMNKARVDHFSGVRERAASLSPSMITYNVARLSPTPVSPRKLAQ
eukprot:gene8142-783_t